MISPKTMFRPLQILSFLFVILAVFSCDISDERDLCCERLTLHYRYVQREMQDDFSQHIDHMRHFLFDDLGRFIKELPPSSKGRQDVRLIKMPVGTYTVITVANATVGRTQLSELMKPWSTLADFRLAITHLESKKIVDASNVHGNGDELFWNSRTFTVRSNRSQYIICDLSNIHCHLGVKVKWNTVPKMDGDYTIRLTQVPTDYVLSPSLADTIRRHSGEPLSAESSPKHVIYTFPKHAGSLGVHEITVPLYNLELEGVFTTLRYSNTHIPTLQIFHGDVAITKPINLGRAFRAWNWLPSSNPEQDYRIELTLYDDGRVLVNQWAETTVLDWIDGGTFGV